MHIGVAYGGPRKGQRMGSPVIDYPIAGMYLKDGEWDEVKRGVYLFDEISRVWWWQGWNKEGDNDTR